MERAQRGFSLLEILIALGVMTTFGLFLLSAIAGLLRTNSALSARALAQTSLDALADRLQAEADSAWAIFTPPADVLGQPNPDGHEVDFFTRDARSRPYFWAYRFDSSSRTLQRYVYASPGGAPSADGSPVTSMNAFAARTYPITALQNSTSPLYSPLFQNAGLTPASVSFGYAQKPWIAGGNQLTHVRFASAYGERSLVLATQTAPSGFTIVLRYTPSPAPPAVKTALVEAASVSGFWRTCPGPFASCDNTLWPQYVWSLRAIYRYYSSGDGGYTWTLTYADEEDDAGISTPTGGDAPYIDCSPGAGVDYRYECSTTWNPAAPPGEAGMDFSVPGKISPCVLPSRSSDLWSRRKCTRR